MIRLLIPNKLFNKYEGADHWEAFSEINLLKLNLVLRGAEDRIFKRLHQFLSCHSLVNPELFFVDHGPFLVSFIRTLVSLDHLEKEKVFLMGLKSVECLSLLVIETINGGS